MMWSLAHYFGSLTLDAVCWVIDYAIDSTPANRRAAEVRRREAFIREWTDGIVD